MPHSTTLQVGKANFRPPPKVDSLVVRIELRNPPPPINFIEWDGLVRLLFNRKNKTCRAILCAKSCLDVLEQNMKTYMSINSIPMPETMPAIKTIVEATLEETGFTESRAAKMAINDFLNLLAAFNARGIHFT